LEKTPEAAIVFPQESISELEKTPKMTSGSKGKLKMRKVQKKQISEPTPQSSRVETRNVQQGQTPEPTLRSSKVKIKYVQEKQVPRPINAIKIKKRKLFEETSTPVSKSEEASLPVRRTTRSMAKQITVPHVPSLPEEPIDIPTSPEKESGYGATISETEGLVTETLRGLRKEKEAREEVIEQTTTSDPDNSLSKQQLIVKIGKLTKHNEKLKQEVTEYQVLDRHIKAENAQLKEYNLRLQDAQEEVSAKLNKVLRLIQYTRVIKKELRSEASGLNILQPDK
jgi:hypothetical protein